MSHILVAYLRREDTHFPFPFFLPCSESEIKIKKEHGQEIMPRLVLIRNKVMGSRGQYIPIHWISRNHMVLS